MSAICSCSISINFGSHNASPAPFPAAFPTKMIFLSSIEGKSPICFALPGLTNPPKTPATYSSCMSSTDTTACSNNNIMPLCIAAFANCTERISCCVNTISSYRTNCLSPLTSVVRQSANGLALFICIASSPESRQPSDVIT